ncbi:MAG: hypothetical protein AAF696_27995 [Bacteroidota bacterium]
MNPSILFPLLYILMLGTLLVYFYINGKKALSIFQDIEADHIKYRESGVSGYSTLSRQTKMGGANKVLQLIVTKDELWVKTHVITAAIGQRFDLIHRIKLENIRAKEGVKEGIQLNFTSAQNEEKQLILISKNPDEFIRALKN